MPFPYSRNAFYGQYLHTILAKIGPLIVSSSFRHILRATAIVGGASAINVLIGLLRNKVAALMVGPVGVGSIGLLLNLVTAVSSIVGLGIAMSGVRELAMAADDASRRQVRQTLNRLTVLLAFAGTLIVWLSRDALAYYALGDSSRGWQVGWLGPAVGLTIWSAMQIAVLNGLRRLGDLAKVQVIGAALGSALGIGALIVWRGYGTVAFVVAAPLGMAAVSAIYVARLPVQASAIVPQVGDPKRQAGNLIRLGVPMMLGSLSLPVGLLLIRTLLEKRLGSDALGQFTAAWTLSATYVGFVLAAMGTDYFPRLSAIIDDRSAACQMVEEQAEVALMLALPVMLGVQATAPWLIRLLYADSFGPAVTILQWQIAGDVFKLASWPLAFIVLAQGRGKLFWGLEAFFMIVMVSGVMVLIGTLGLAATGVAYFIAYALYLTAVAAAARYLIGFRLRGRVVALTTFGVAGMAILGTLAAISPAASLIAGSLAAAIAAEYAVRCISGSTPYRLLKSLRIGRQHVG